MRTVVGVFAAMISVVACASAQASDCVGLRNLPQRAPAEDRNFWDRVMQMVNDAGQEECGSLTTVVDKVLNRKRTGGRKLEGDKPFDQAVAQANLQKALEDAAIRKRFEDARAQIADENARLLYEAAILDSEGYYDARELRIRQLLERLASGS